MPCDLRSCGQALLLLRCSRGACCLDDERARCAWMECHYGPSLRVQGEINSTYLSLMREATDVMGAEYGIWSLVCAANGGGWVGVGIALTSRARHTLAQVETHQDVMSEDFCGEVCGVPRARALLCCILQPRWRQRVFCCSMHGTPDAPARVVRTQARLAAVQGLPHWAVWTGAAGVYPANGSFPWPIDAPYPIDAGGVPLPQFCAGRGCARARAATRDERARARIHRGSSFLGLHRVVRRRVRGGAVQQQRRRAGWVRGALGGHCGRIHDLGWCACA